MAKSVGWELILMEMPDNYVFGDKMIPHTPWEKVFRL